MITVKSTFQLDGQNNADYQKIIAYFESHGHEQAGYTLVKEPILNRVTAYKTDMVDKI